MAQALVVAVTGASGFIGRALLRKLRSLAIQACPVGRAQGHDLLRPETLEDIPDFDFMVHLAARSFVPDAYDDYASYQALNVEGTRHCLELCRARGASMVFASSYVYGQPRYLPVDEAHPVSPWNPYARTKLEAEALCGEFDRAHHVRHWIFRLFNVYGPGQSPHFLVPKILGGFARGSLRLETATPRRDFVYVDDVVEALAMPLTGRLNGERVYNVGSGHSVSVSELVELVRQFSGIDVPVSYTGHMRANEIMDLYADTTRLRARGWKPVVTIESGLGYCWREILAK